MEINKNFNSLLTAAMKAKDELRKSVLRAIKSEFLIFCSDPSNAGKGLTLETIEDSDVKKILNSMVKKRIKAVEEYRTIGSEKAIAAANNELAEVDIIKEFLPAAASEADVLNEINNIKASGKTNIGEFMKVLQVKFPEFDGKTLSTLVKNNI